MRDRLCAGADPVPGAGAAEHEFEGRPEPLRHQLEVVLEAAVVGQIQIGNPRRIAAAAEILEQCRIIDGPPLFAGKVQGGGDATGNPAGAQRMAGGLTFGQIERVGESPEDLGKRGRLVGARRREFSGKCVAHEQALSPQTSLFA
ncbi:hypothetical protein [Allosphingosinicella deserti]|uniref:hypothetical protein n=1 Tax=Allosphingosinicella deserti TaxID=2116704 RepID=UPI0018EA6C22|nr:hypothetical protein [Sphingomonas deserti]